MTNTDFQPIDSLEVSMTVDLRQLRHFVAVAEELSFRNAAIRLNMSQPPLSSSIRQLEESLGTTLLERNTRNVSLTRVGEIFLREARRTLAQADHAVELAKRAGEGIVGSLRMTFVASAALGIFPRLVMEFRMRHPEADIRLDADTTGSQLAALDRGRSDIALIVVPMNDRSKVTLIPFRREQILLAVPKDHSFAGAATVDIADLAQEVFITFPFSEGPGFESLFLSACQSAGFSPNIHQEVSQMLTKVMLVATGMGIALVPSSFRTLQMSDVIFIPITAGGQVMVYDMAFAISKQNDNPLIERFLDVAKAFQTPDVELARSV